MWNAVPTTWFSWDFEVRDAAHRAVADVRLSSWRERGAVTLGGVEYAVSRQGILGPFLLKRDGAVLASAEKPSALRSTFRIEHAGNDYTLEKRSMWRRELVLQAGKANVGSIAPNGLLTRSARIDLPEDLPPIVRLFAIWLALLLWKRDADA